MALYEIDQFELDRIEQFTLQKVAQDIMEFF
jgi:hypothetical protein